MENNYCEYCGKKLDAKFVFSHYAANNGGKLYKKFLVCPSRRWWNAFLHVSFLVVGGSFGNLPQYYTEDSLSLNS